MLVSYFIYSNIIFILIKNTEKDEGLLLKIGRINYDNSIDIEYILDNKNFNDSTALKESIKNYGVENLYVQIYDNNKDTIEFEGIKLNCQKIFNDSKKEGKNSDNKNIKFIEINEKNNKINILDDEAKNNGKEENIKSLMTKQLLIFSIYQKKMTESKGRQELKENENIILINKEFCEKYFYNEILYLVSKDEELKKEIDNIDINNFSISSIKNIINLDNEKINTINNKISNVNEANSLLKPKEEEVYLIGSMNVIN